MTAEQAKEKALLTDKELDKIIKEHWADNTVTRNFHSSYKKVIKAQRDQAFDAGFQFAQETVDTWYEPECDKEWG